MPDVIPTVYVQGTASRLDLRFSRDQNNEPEVIELWLTDVAKSIIVPYRDERMAEMAAPVSAICVDQDASSYFGVDLIVGTYGRIITDEERDAMFVRLGMRPLYAPTADICSAAALKNIKSVETELILYLRRHPERMRDLHSDAFEKLVAELLASFGFDVQWTGRNNETGGDVIAIKVDSGSGLCSNYLVECKRYSGDNPVGIEIARTLYGAKVDEGYANALLVTTSRFTEGAEQFAARRWDFALRDFQGLIEWLNLYRPREDGKLHMEGRRLVVQP